MQQFMHNDSFTKAAWVLQGYIADHRNACILTNLKQYHHAARIDSISDIERT